jgi:purine nucleosidase
MCGVFTAAGGQGPAAREWNALVDPVATALVFRHAVPGTLLSVGLDVTTRCQLPQNECRERFTRAGGALGVVAQMAEVWFKHASQITFHDPLAAALVFAPDLCKTQAGRVDVFTDDNPLTGLTRWSANEKGPHVVATDVEPAAFFAHYFGIVDRSAA